MSAIPKPSPSTRLAWLIGMLALAMSISTVALVHHYGATRPTVPMEQLGRTRAAKIHGKTVYLTSGEYAVAFGSHVIAVVTIGVFLGVLLKSRRPQS